MNPSLTVLIPTYNRSSELRETLEALCKVERDGLTVEFVIIDNNSKDNTKQIVESFSEQLPLSYLYEPNQGKNFALNKAIKEVELGEIIVCTDDDVVPNPDWLKQIIDISNRWTRNDVFGGATYLIWPEDKTPAWLGKGPQGSTWDLSGHGRTIEEKERVYAPKRVPTGPNFWVRKKIFDKGYRFDNTFGPNAKINVMGDDVSFLLMLRKDGYEPVFSSYSIVGRRIQSEMFSHAGIRKRVIGLARGSVYLNGLCHEKLLRRSVFLWHIMRFGSLARSIIQYLNPINYITGDRGYAVRLEKLYDITYNLESIKLGLRQTFVNK